MSPASMKAITLPAYQGNIIRALRSLELRTTQISELQAHEVLIEVRAASTNPSDLAFIQGGYNVRKALPAIPGFEGTGRVILSGSSAGSKQLDGKRVSFFTQTDCGGSWASHSVVSSTDCIEIDDDLSDEQAACFSVNPFTAYAMVDLAMKQGCKAIIQNAAAGQVGKFINVLAARANMPVINIVRKEAHVEMLQSAGVQHILWSQDEDFYQKLNGLATNLHATIAFDAVGGEQSGHLLRSMPADSRLYLYGALGGRTLSEIPAADVIFSKKSIHGFNMNDWKGELSVEALGEIIQELQGLFKEGVLKTDIQGSFPLADYEKALMQYIRDMSGGKVLLIPSE